MKQNVIIPYISYGMIDREKYHDTNFYQSTVLESFIITHYLLFKNKTGSLLLLDRKPYFISVRVDR